MWSTSESELATIARLCKKIQTAVERPEDMYASIEVVVDTRERKQDFLSRVLERLPCVSRRALPCGDVWILVNGRVAFAIERKQLDDLLNSIKDPRMVTQKAGLYQLPVNDTTQLMYLIEELPDETQFYTTTEDALKSLDTVSEAKSATSRGMVELYGSIGDLIVRDWLSVLVSHSKAHSVVLILELVWKSIEHWESVLKMTSGQASVDASFLQHPDEAERRHDAYQSSLRKRKALSEDSEWLTHVERRFVDVACSLNETVKRGHNPRTAYVTLLSSIERVSRSRAEAIASVFPTLHGLLEFIHDESIPQADRISKLRNIQASATDAVNRSKVTRPVDESAARRLGEVGENVFRLLYSGSPKKSRKTT